LEDLGLSPEAIERALASAPSNRRFSENSEDDEDEDSDTASAASVNFGARGSSSTAPEESEPEEAATGDVFAPVAPLLRSQVSLSPNLSCDHYTKKLDRLAIRFLIVKLSSFYEVAIILVGKNNHLRNPQATLSPWQLSLRCQHL